MVHFTPLQVILNIVIALLAVALPTWVLWIVGSKIPPALTCEGRKSGFAGSLPFFTATLVFFFLYWVIMTAVDAAQAYRFILMSVDYTSLQILMPMIPDVLFVLIFGWVIVRLTMKRSSRVVAEAVAVIWVLGPIGTLGSFFFYQTPDLNVTGLFASFFYALAATVYLVFSDRVALTYGTRRGRSLRPLKVSAE